MNKILAAVVFSIAIVGIVAPKHIVSHQSATGLLPTPTCGPGMKCAPPPGPCGK